MPLLCRGLSCILRRLEPQRLRRLEPERLLWPCLRRSLSDAATPRFEVPRHLVEVSHSHSSGPGGQNVNKVSTKVDLRLDLSSTPWLPSDVRERLLVQAKSHVHRRGLLIQCGETRSQARNLQLAFARLQGMVDAASVAPMVKPERVIDLEPPAHLKRRRKDAKRQQAHKKQNRGGRGAEF